MNRAGQFFRALSARIGAEDERYIAAHLPPKGQELFFAMHLADQYHALNVAYTAETLADEHGSALDREFLIRCALLHDVGRVKGDLGIMGKVLAVLVHSFFPEASMRWAKQGWHLMHVYYHHPEMGAEKLMAAGFREEAAVVRLHHQPPQDGDSPVLRILRKADEMN